MEPTLDPPDYLDLLRENETLKIKLRSLEQDKAFLLRELAGAVQKQTWPPFEGAIAKAIREADAGTASSPTSIYSPGELASC